MSATATEHERVAHAATGARTRRPQRGRYFFAVAAIIMLALMVAGFHPYYLRGKGMAGRTISPELATLVFVHGTALSAWLLLFLVQSLLVPARRLRLHMRLGWGGILVATVAAISGFMLAVQSVRPVPTIPFWGMTYQQFLLVMLSEVALFSLFVFAGVLLRKRPKLHRSAMLLASLSILAGATVRMPVLFPVFGEAGSLGIYGPILTFGAALVLVRSALSGATDRGLAAGYAVMAVALIAVSEFAVTDAGTVLAGVILRP